MSEVTMSTGDGVYTVFSPEGYSVSTADPAEAVRVYEEWQSEEGN
jgi:hypothetical protein